jgi:UDP-GlcNAc:undecaprenyl-phosphate GlcNAc-1-phosphate transferase
VTQGGRDHTSHRLVYFGLSEAKAVALLASIAILLGASGVAYNVLDRPALTAVGVLLTAVLLVQFGAFLGELSESARAGRPGDTRLRHALTIEPRRLLEVVADFAITSGAFLAAYLIVVGGTGSNNQKGTFLAALPIVLGVRAVAFVGLRIYRHAWRYAIGSDFAVLTLAVVASEIVAYAIVEATRRLGDFPARVFLVDLALVLPLVAAIRLAQRRVPHASTAGRRGRAIVVGADALGRGLARDLRTSGVAVVGFVDDDPRLERRRVLGIPVVGSTGDLHAVIESLRADRVVVPYDVDDRIAVAAGAACAAAGVSLERVGIAMDAAP